MPAPPLAFRSHPNADEICDGVDNNCNDEIDEEAIRDRRYLASLQHLLGETLPLKNFDGSDAAPLTSSGGGSGHRRGPRGRRRPGRDRRGQRHHHARSKD